MSVKAKFKVNSIEHRTGFGPNKVVATIKLSPVYSSDPESENGKFYAATPSGNIELGTINEEASKQFILDKEYFVTFEEA